MENKVLLQEVAPYDLLARMIDEGYVRTQTHPSYPELAILNYSEKAQFDRLWNEATNVCRGLVVASDGGRLSPDSRVVARGFNKFHNLNTEYVPETMEANLPQGEVPLVTTKLDGSMGLLYVWDNRVWMATRGSFDSAQARWATAWARERLAPLMASLQNHTAVFEIVYAENRIVVDYGWEGCVLLGGVDLRTGRECARTDLERWAALSGLEVVPRFDKSLAECAREDNPNEEGYVLTYPSTGLKVKVKFSSYVRLHRILTGLNPKSVWELLAEKSGSAVHLLLGDEKIPEGFKAWLRGWADELGARHGRIEAEALAVFRGRPTDEAPDLRKRQALYFQREARHLCSVLFAMLDGKDHDSVIWGMVKPRADEAFRKDGE